MIKLTLMYNREIMHFVVEGKSVYYTDRVWKSWIRCLPEPKDFIKAVRMSRNKIPSKLADMFNLSQKDIDEYSSAQSEDALAELIVKDAKSKGCRVISKDTVDKEKFIPFEGEIVEAKNG